MEIKFLGGNCIKFITKKINILVDDTVNTENKCLASEKDIVIRTYHSDENPKSHFLIDSPGEYEVSEVSIKGIPARSHVDGEETGKNATIYRLLVDDIRIGIIGHIHPDLSDDQLEELGIVDILFVPVGGNGFTLDGVAAGKIIRKIEPKIVVPTNYHDGKTKYEVPPSDLATALTALGMEPSETVQSLKIKGSDIATMSDSTRLIVIEPKN